MFKRMKQPGTIRYDELGAMIQGMVMCDRLPQDQWIANRPKRAVGYFIDREVNRKL